MRKNELVAENKKALAQARAFRETVPPEELGVLTPEFHKNKNGYPYFGFVEARHGDAGFVMFSSNDDLVAMTYFWFGPNSYEAMSMQLWLERARTAQVVLDVGAFSGVYALAAAQAARRSRIFALEAARRTYGRLLVNVQANRLNRRISCENLAVSDGPGHETFLRYRGENILGIGDSFTPKDLEVLESRERVETIGLDQFCAARDLLPDLIKIDVEGAEILALQGMPDILAARQATILIEVTTDTAPRVHEILRAQGYRVGLVDETRKRLDPFDGQVTEALIKGMHQENRPVFSVNLLAEPE